MGVILDLLLLFVLVRAIRRFLGGLFEGLSAKRRQPASPRGAVHMARDPICGTFVVPERAVSLTIGQERTYFCSTACLDQFRAHHRVHGRTA